MKFKDTKHIEPTNTCMQKYHKLEIAEHVEMQLHLIKLKLQKVGFTTCQNGGFFDQA
jgi:hypothetical protein